MSMRYYKEPGGDYIVLWGEGSGLGGSDYEGRATSILHCIESVSTMGICKGWIGKCKRVAKRDVPKEWLAALGGTK